MANARVPVNSEIGDSNEPTVLGIDVGGTAIKLGHFNRACTCLHSLTVPTPQPPKPEAVFSVLLDAIAQLDPHRHSTAIGIGLPGPTDATARIARISINLPDWHDIPLADQLELHTGCPIVLANDANCAGLGELHFGAGRPFRNFILLTLGTGVGGAIILNGELLTGYQGAAGELGLITLRPGGPPCNSGNNGSLEQYVSLRAIQRMTGKEPIELGHLAQAGDPEALAFWTHYGQDLGAGLASLIYVLTPEAILLGGGISASAKFFLPATTAEIERRVLLPSREGLKILPAALGNEAGMAGAATLAWKLLQANNMGQEIQ